MQGPKISGPNGVSYINANVEANWVVKNNDDDQIDVYAQDETIKILIYQSTNPQTGSASFIKYADFANELGDIKYVYDVIKNRNDLDVWTNSSGVNDPLYFSKEGAGEYSRQYSKERVKDVNDFINKNSNARLSDNETIKN